MFVGKCLLNYSSDLKKYFTNEKLTLSLRGIDYILQPQTYGIQDRATPGTRYREAASFINIISLQLPTIRNNLNTICQELFGRCNNELEYLYKVILIHYSTLLWLFDPHLTLQIFEPFDFRSKTAQQAPIENIQKSFRFFNATKINSKQPDSLSYLNPLINNPHQLNHNR